MIPGIAFPGQGNKKDATVAALRRHGEHPLVREFLAGAEPESLDLGDTSVSQPATYAAGIASAQEAFSVTGVPVVLGHSLGELTAAAFAGVLDPHDGFALAQRRGEICHAQQSVRAGAMIAVMGTDVTGAEWLRRQAVARSGGVIEIAGLNGKRQTVLSGDVAAVEACVEVAKEIGAIVEVLPIGGSFHSPLMHGAIPKWREAVEAVEFRAPTVPFVSSVDGQAHDDPMQIRELVIRALLLPVRWLDAMRTVRALGVEQLWDAGPGTTLARLAKRESIVKFVALEAAQ
jgi:[acyl-carrier-protein] S-malonyltransferase